MLHDHDRTDPDRAVEIVALWLRRWGSMQSDALGGQEPSPTERCLADLSGSELLAAFPGSVFLDDVAVEAMF